jgi:sec-independent protein translocase protein TatA
MNTNLPMAFIQNMGWGEWLVILAVALLLFGSKKLPELARSVGKSVNEFKRGLADVQNNVHKAAGEDDKSDSEK